MQAQLSRKGFPLSKLIIWLFLFILVWLTYEVIMRFLEPKVLPIRHVKLISLGEHVDTSNLKKQIKPEIKGFFSTDVMKLKQAVAGIPFVDEVVVKRLWPDTLLLSLKEVRLVAYWGKAGVVDAKGNIITAKMKYKPNLPVFNGPEGQAGSMVETYEGINQLLIPLKLSICTLNLNPRRSWEITLCNGTQVFLGRKDILAHMRSLAMLWPKLTRSSPKIIDAIDLRYSNGLAVHTAP